MKNVTKLTVLMAIFWSLALGGCAAKRCETICDHFDDCLGLEGTEGECIESCVDADEYEGTRCQEAVSALADCLDGLGCETSWDECDAEIVDYFVECYDAQI